MSSMPKKIMVLGGSHFQMPVIVRAKEMGHYVITCDYLPDNPGHKISDEYHNVSTTDKIAVLNLAKKIGIDAILTLSSDPAIPTVAFVANSLGLSGPSPEAVEILSEKNLFREHLKRNGLNTPKFVVIDANFDVSSLEDVDYKYIIKPVDSCGSKGITFSPKKGEEFEKSINLALTYSRCKKCIVEEYIEGDQIHGDGYLEEGNLIYCYLGDHFFYTKSNNFIPISTRWPTKYGKNIIDDVKNQVEIVCKSVNYFNGPLNIEARVYLNDVYLIEVAPRNGGNFVPIIQQYLTGFDFIEKIILYSLGIRNNINNSFFKNKIGAHYILHAKNSGFFNGIYLDLEIKNNIFYKNVFKNIGDEVFEYVGSHTTIGVVLLEFENILERDSKMNKIDELVKIYITE